MKDENSNSGDWNSGYGNSGHRNSGHGNSGYGNSTSRESGIFCSTECKVRLFNKDTDLTWEEINHPHFNEFELCKWIPESEMTDEEKNNESDYSVRGGYLKEYSYENAWSNFWRDTDEENKKTFLNLPNFDSEVFKEITGIDIESDSNELTIEQLEKLTGIKNLKIKK